MLLIASLSKASGRFAATKAKSMIDAYISRELIFLVVGSALIGPSSNGVSSKHNSERGGGGEPRRREGGWGWGLFIKLALTLPATVFCLRFMHEALPISLADPVEPKAFVPCNLRTHERLRNTRHFVGSEKKKSMEHSHHWQGHREEVGSFIFS